MTYNPEDNTTERRVPSDATPGARTVDPAPYDAERISRVAVAAAVEEADLVELLDQKMMTTSQRLTPDQHRAWRVWVLDVARDSHPAVTMEQIVEIGARQPHLTRELLVNGSIPQVWWDRLDELLAPKEKPEKAPLGLRHVDDDQLVVRVAKLAGVTPREVSVVVEQHRYAPSVEMTEIQARVWNTWSEITREEPVTSWTTPEETRENLEEIVGEEIDAGFAVIVDASDATETTRIEYRKWYKRRIQAGEACEILSGRIRDAIGDRDGVMFADGTVVTLDDEDHRWDGLTWNKGDRNER